MTDRPRPWRRLCQNIWQPCQFGIVLATLGGVLGAALSLGLVYAIGILLADGEMGHDLVVLVAILFVALPACELDPTLPCSGPN